MATIPKMSGGDGDVRVVVSAPKGRAPAINDDRIPSTRKACVPCRGVIFTADRPSAKPRRQPLDRSSRESEWRSRNGFLRNARAKTTG